MKKILDYLQKYPYKSAIIIFIFVFVLYFNTVKFFYPKMSERGLFGDMFGGINAIFSGLAFLGIIYAIILQGEELRLQREELELTRKELQRTAQAQEKSEEALSKQAASLKATAKLNGLSALLSHFDKVEEKNPQYRKLISSDFFNVNDIEDYVRQIKEIVNQK
jgi:hypothetical protein